MPVGTKNQAIAGLGTHHIAIQTRDYAAAMAFYIDVLGMRTAVEFTAGDGRQVALLDIGDGSHLELFSPRPDAPAAEGGSDDICIHFALTTTDIAAALEKVKAAGMEITVDLRDANLGGVDVTIAFFKGPSGEIVEFFQVND